MTAQLAALRNLVQVVDPQLHAFFEAKECLQYFFCYRWLLIHFKREFAFEEVRPAVAQPAIAQSCCAALSGSSQQATGRSADHAAAPAPSPAARHLGQCLTSAPAEAAQLLSMDVMQGKAGCTGMSLQSGTPALHGPRWPAVSAGAAAVGSFMVAPPGPPPAHLPGGCHPHTPQAHHHGGEPAAC